MFEFQKLLDHEPTRIVVQTRHGRDIRNEIGAGLTEEHVRRYELLVSKYGSAWRTRKPPTAGYNCAGHVWASRRTAIYEDDEWNKILKDDGYRKTEHPQPDDLVLYFDRKHGWLHVARVVELQPGFGQTSSPIPCVTSKINDWGGEVVHSVFDAPFAAQGFDVAFEFWTDRPKT